MGGVVALGMLWWASRQSVEPVSLSAKGLVFRHDKCVWGVPVTSLRQEHLTADVLEIDRTSATLPDGEEIVQERVTMAPNYRFDKPADALVAALFHLQKPRTLWDNGRVLAVAGTLTDGREVRILAVYKGKADLTLLYPVPTGLFESLTTCLLKGDKPEGATVVNRVVEGNEKEKAVRSDWRENLFTLGLIVNKDQ